MIGGEMCRLLLQLFLLASTSNSDERVAAGELIQGRPQQAKP